MDEAQLVVVQLVLEFGLDLHKTGHVIHNGRHTFHTGFLDPPERVCGGREPIRTTHRKLSSAHVLLPDYQSVRFRILRAAASTNSSRGAPSRPHTSFSFAVMASGSCRTT